MDKPWVPDVVGRAWGNRGNARSRQVRPQQHLPGGPALAACAWRSGPQQRPLRVGAGLHCPLVAAGCAPGKIWAADACGAGGSGQQSGLTAR
jgi:hypothetical protein